MNVGKNISMLCKTFDINQRELSKIMDLAVGTINNIFTDKKSPSLDFMVELINMPQFNACSLSIDDFLLPENDFNDLLATVAHISPIQNNYIRKDMAGCYLIYYFDQSKEYLPLKSGESRKLRYGVLAIYEAPQYAENAQVKFKSAAKFFDDKDEAKKLHKAVSEIYNSMLSKDADKIDIKGIEDAVRNSFNDNDSYDGDVDFREHHVFIDLTSYNFGDHALFALHSPQKRNDSDYIGGVASLSSVSRGRSHNPCAQKALISRYILECSDEEVSLLIRNNPVNSSMETEAKDMYDFFNNLREGGLGEMLDLQDRINLFSGRFRQVINNYFNDTVCSVGIVTDEDDSKAYRLIKSQMSKPEVK